MEAHDIEKEWKRLLRSGLRLACFIPRELWGVIDYEDLAIAGWIAYERCCAKREKGRGWAAYTGLAERGAMMDEIRQLAFRGRSKKASPAFVRIEKVPDWEQPVAPACLPPLEESFRRITEAIPTKHHLQEIFRERFLGPDSLSQIARSHGIKLHTLTVYSTEVRKKVEEELIGQRGSQ